MPFAKNIPTAVVELDKPRTIALNLDALLRLEEITGQPIMETRFEPSQIVKQIDAWIWAGLGDEDRAEISRAEIRQMVHVGNLAKIMGVIAALITASLPDAEEGKQSPAPPKPRRVVAGKS